MALRKIGAVQMRTALRWTQQTQRQQALSCSRSVCSRSVGREASTPAAAAAAAARVTGVACARRHASVSADVHDVTRKFGDPSFWEGEYSSQFESQEELQPFEWFLPYDGGLRQHLLPFLESMPSCTRLLHVGSGTSEVGPKLATEPDLKLHVTDADSSPSAVRLMKRRHADLDNYTCHQADVLNLPFPEGSFDAVVDKGTLDALLCRSVEDAEMMAAEMHRVLTKGGVYVHITTEDPEARLELLSTPSKVEHQPWARSLFKEIGEGADATYFMYVLVK